MPRITIGWNRICVFCAVWQEEKWVHKVWKALKQVFIPRDLLACRYAVAVDSPKLYLYYPVRLLSLLVRYSGLIGRIQTKPSEYTVYKRKATLVEWLDHGAQDRIQLDQP